MPSIYRTTTDRSCLVASSLPALSFAWAVNFTLPVGTPGNAIAYSSGYLRLRDMLGPGAVLVVIAWAAFNLVAIYYWPLIGLHLVAP